jgi:hypothetical protein
MITLTGGAFQDAVGTPLSGGRLVLQLSTDAQQTVTNPDGQVISGLPISLTLDADGNIPSTELWSNEELAPAGTYYTVRLFSSSGQHVWAKPQTWVFSQDTGQSLDIGTIVPGSVTTPSYPGAVIKIPDADQTITGSYKVINSGGFQGPVTGNVTGSLTGDVTGNITSAGASSFVSMSTRQLNGFIFMADRYPGDTAAQKINAAMAAAVLVGGGVVDARGLGGAQTIDEQINVRAYTVLMLPGAAEWQITITDGTSSGIKQFGNSSIVGNGTLLNRMIIKGAASANVDSFYRTDEAPGEGGSYIRAEGFQLFDVNNSTISTAIANVQHLYDNSMLSNINVSCNGGSGKTGMRVFNAGYGTNFRNITVNMLAHGRCVLLEADANHSNYQIAFYDLSATHPESGYAAVEITGPSSQYFNNKGIAFVNFHVEFSADNSIGMKVVNAIGVHVCGVAMGVSTLTGVTGFDLSETVAGTLRDFSVDGFVWGAGAGNDALNNHITGETNSVPTRYFPSYSYGGTTGAMPVSMPEVTVDSKKQFKDASGNVLVELPNNSGTNVTANTGFRLGIVGNAAYSIIASSSDGASGELFNINPAPALNTAAASVRLFRDTNTSGARRVIVYKGDGTSTETASIDVDTGKAILNGGLVVNNVAAPTVGANQLGLGSTTATTVGAPGGASALPATPTGYLIVNIAGTNFKIPYYAN